jgi:polysaccharide pyruvyl transferase WcaK-like protein
LSDEPFDAVLVGADIVWDFRNPNLGKDPVYFGKGLKTTQLISWAASMGGCALDGEIPEYVREGIPKFKAISVRDEKTAELVGKVSEHTAQVLFDPALSLDIKAVPRGVAPKGPYIAVYTIPELVTQDFVAQAKAFAKQKGLPLYAVMYRNKWVDQNFVDTSPENWVSMLDHAEYVVTNTFHGTIFSILLGKQFAMEYNPAIESKTRGMMEYLGLDSRVVRVDVCMEYILLENWDKEEVCRRIRDRVSDSLIFLNKALS